MERHATTSANKQRAQAQRKRDPYGRRAKGGDTLETATWGGGKRQHLPTTKKQSHTNTTRDKRQGDDTRKSEKVGGGGGKQR